MGKNQSLTRPKAALQSFAYGLAVPGLTEILFPVTWLRMRYSRVSESISSRTRVLSIFKRCYSFDPNGLAVEHFEYVEWRNHNFKFPSD